MKEGGSIAEIGKNIKRLRIEKNMKQEEVAEKLFVSRQTISNYENGKSRPDVDMIVKIAEILETDVNTLVYEGERQCVDRKKVICTVIKLCAVVFLAIVSYLLYKKLWKTDLSDKGFETAISMCYILRAGFFSLISIFIGYYMVELLQVLLQKEYVCWKYASVLHKIAGGIIVIYHVIVLPFCINMVRGVINYYQWEKNIGEGYYSYEYGFLPVWDKVSDHLLVFQWETPIIFPMMFVVLGMIYRITTDS